MTREAEDFKAEAECYANLSMCGTDWISLKNPKRGKPPILLVVELNYFSPDWRGDVDNTLKLTLDAIAKGIGYNDRYFLPRAMSREIDAKRPRIEVRIYREEAFEG
jgi:Holliday junction resolvase RusA-like endonuclease